jgi:hypothetical protein
VAALIKLYTSTLINIAVRRFITPVIAVQHFVADQLLINALTGVASEILWIRACYVFALRGCKFNYFSFTLIDSFV